MHDWGSARSLIISRPLPRSLLARVGSITPKKYLTHLPRSVFVARSYRYSTNTIARCRASIARVSEALASLNYFMYIYE
jgi:hypothetical protein